MKMPADLTARLMNICPGAIHLGPPGTDCVADSFLRFVAARGVLWEGPVEDSQPGIPGHCHENVSRLVGDLLCCERPYFSWAAGFGYWDSQWALHSALLDTRRGVLLERVGNKAKHYLIVPGLYDADFRLCIARKSPALIPLRK